METEWATEAQVKNRRCHCVFVVLSLLEEWNICSNTRIAYWDRTAVQVATRSRERYVLLILFRRCRVVYLDLVASLGLLANLCYRLRYLHYCPADVLHGVFQQETFESEENKVRY